MKKNCLTGLLVLSVIAFVGWNSGYAANLRKISSGGHRRRLYTAPDPACSGGIRGTIVKPQKDIEEILAIPADEPHLVYEGAVGENMFEFTNLPMRKYDLLVVYKDQFIEGLRLQTRESNTLTAKDLTSIKSIIDKSEPYFTKKIIHRVEGVTGRGNRARAICTFLRDKKSKGVSGMRRTFKLVMLKQVANLRTGMPGWQVERCRDLYPVFTDKKHVTIKHSFNKKLSNIRVSDSIKDLGNISL